jgi:Outer membrane protein beta-barrel domain
MRNFAIAALLIASVSAPARAAQEVAVRLSAELASDNGLYATGSSKSLLQAELGYAHTVRSFRRAQIWIEGSWTIGERHDSLFSTWTTSLLAQQFTVGVRGTFPVRRWFVPQVRGGMGAMLGTLRINGLESGGFDETSSAFTSYVLAGAQLLLPRPWTAQGKHLVTAGLVVEAGYCYSSSMRYSLSPAGTPDTLQMPSVPTELGTVSLSGPLFRVGALLRF